MRANVYYFGGYWIIILDNSAHFQHLLISSIVVREYVAHDNVSCHTIVVSPKEYVRVQMFSYSTKFKVVFANIDIRQ